jgi:NIMA (never in mitosis gene a)-related kinase
MEYIEGAPLTEHFNSLKEKKDTFSEERIWNIFVQVGRSKRMVKWSMTACM